MGYGWDLCGCGHGGYMPYPEQPHCRGGFGPGRGFALLVVLFILLIIIGASYVPNNCRDHGHHHKKDC
ncbi:MULTISPECIES: YjcZ family sporulation protein [Sporosarcina]|uniref:YjcZ family sporulation protein n=1 Tax=Sporosarcina TaxID=1569 RepID=UPI0009E3AAC6